MKVVALIEIDKKAEIIDEIEVEIDLDEFNLSKLTKIKDKDISGQWVILDELLEIQNDFLISYQNEKEKNTMIKLPPKYVKENYLIDYEPEDECPLGVDLLVTENNYPIGVIAGCDSIKQAKVNNNLDGHRYQGQLGIKLNDDYFLYYDEDEAGFDISKTSKDWDRGKNTI